MSYSIIQHNNVNSYILRYRFNPNIFSIENTTENKSKINKLKFIGISPVKKY